MGNVEDLSEGSGTKMIPTIPRNIAIAVFAILTISGILVGAILPDLIEGSTDEEENDPAVHIMDTIVASSIPTIVIEETTYTNIPMPSLFQVLFRTGNTGNNSELDNIITEMMEFMVGDSASFKLTVHPGTGFGPGITEYVLGDGSGQPDGDLVREVPVGLGEDEGSVIFELMIWGVPLE
jgi:hypothetical protein